MYGRESLKFQYSYAHILAHTHTHSYARQETQKPELGIFSASLELANVLKAVHVSVCVCDGSGCKLGCLTPKTKSRRISSGTCVWVNVYVLILLFLSLFVCFYRFWCLRFFALSGHNRNVVILPFIAFGFVVLLHKLAHTDTHSHILITNFSQLFFVCHLRWAFHLLRCCRCNFPVIIFQMGYTAARKTKTRKHEQENCCVVIFCSASSSSSSFPVSSFFWSHFVQLRDFYPISDFIHYLMT